jgi:hypothetical protein
LGQYAVHFLLGRFILAVALWLFCILAFTKAVNWFFPLPRKELKDPNSVRV